MRFFIVALFMSVGLAATPPAPSEGTFAAGLAALAACAARLDRELDVGYERVAVRCPELRQQLAAAGVDRWLPASWQDPHNDLSAGSLLELRTALAREHAMAPVGRAPSAPALKASLLGKVDAQAHSSLWRRFVNWLRDFFSARSAPQEPGFLSRLVSRVGLPETLIRITTYVAFALTIALALLILANELRAAGVLRARARPAERRGSAAATTGDANTWIDVEQAPLTERPRLLLTLILERIARLSGVAPARSLTTGELTRTLHLGDSANTQRLITLATIAERVRYAAAPVSDEDLGGALAGGRRVLEALAAPREAAAP